MSPAEVALRLGFLAAGVALLLAWIAVEASDREVGVVCLVVLIAATVGCAVVVITGPKAALLGMLL